jgi:hypothetical protein
MAVWEGIKKMAQTSRREKECSIPKELEGQEGT